MRPHPEEPHPTREMVADRMRGCWPKQTIGQDPWLSFPALPPVYFAGLPAAAPTQPLLSEAGKAWAEIKDTSNASILEAFISEFRKTLYGAFARESLEEVSKHAVAVE